MNVAMLHSIGMESLNLPYSFLSMPVLHFEQMCKFIRKQGISTKLLRDWSSSDSKNLYLTFDDGFLDNWVYAFPIAKKYNIRFSIFINPEFIQSEGSARPMYEAGNPKDIQNEAVGYLNWTEIHAMLDSGLVDIQSHSMSHTRYPVSATVVDIMNQTNHKKYPWVIWNQNVSQKPDYLNRDFDAKLDNFPVFEFGRSLGIRRYIFDFSVLSVIQDYCSKLSSMTISKEEGLKRVNDFIFANSLFGALESEDALLARYRYELGESKKILENRFGREMNILAWPGGAYNQLSIRVSKELGYKASTSASAGDAKPLAWENYQRIPRFGISSVLTYRGNNVLCDKRMPSAILSRRYLGKRSVSSYLLAAKKILHR